MTGVVQYHLYNTMEGKKERKTRGNMGSKNEMGKKNHSESLI